MIDYIDNIFPERKDKEYKNVIWKVVEYIERGFKQDDEILGYFASKSDATLFVYKLKDSSYRHFIIEAIGVK